MSKLCLDAESRKPKKVRRKMAKSKHKGRRKKGRKKRGKKMPKNVLLYFQYRNQGMSKQLAKKKAGL